MKHWAHAALSAGVWAALGAIAVPARAAEDVLPPQIVHEPCEFYEKGKAYVILARFYDDSPIFDPKIVYRTGKVQDWRSASFTKLPDSDDFGATVKARDLKGKLEYFIETFDENGNGPARYGSPEAPVRVNPADRPPECKQTSSGEQSPVSSVESSKPDKGGGEKSGGEPATSGGGSTSTSGSSSAPAAGGDAGGGTTRTETITAAAGTEGGINTPPPPPAKTGCDADDPPGYCSPVLWVVLSVGVLALGGGGAALGVCLGTTMCTGAAATQPRDKFNLVINSGPPTSVLPP